MRWFALVVLAACNADIGEPTSPVIYQDAGLEAEAEASAPRPVGADCTDASGCESAICFVGGQASYCSLKCTNDNAGTVCSVAPFDGTCNKQGFCRRP